jgi:hypothetical protein
LTAQVAARCRKTPNCDRDEHDHDCEHNYDLNDRNTAFFIRNGLSHWSERRREDGIDETGFLKGGRVKGQLNF